jgi:hypothetical protein
MNGEFESVVKGSGRGLIEVLIPAFTRMGLGTPRNTTVRIAGGPTEIRTKHLPDTNLER